MISLNGTYSNMVIYIEYFYNDLKNPLRTRKGRNIFNYSCLRNVEFLRQFLRASWQNESAAISAKFKTYLFKDFSAKHCLFKKKKKHSLPFVVLLFVVMASHSLYYLC